MLLLALLLVPSLSHQLFAARRAMTLETFLKQLEETQTLDPQKYWKFREHYSPGNFTFNRELVTLTGTLEMKNPIPNPEAQETVLLEFHSPLLSSQEIIVRGRPSLSELLVERKLPNQTTRFQNEGTAVFQDGAGNIQLFFLRSSDDLRRANGLFDYRKHEVEFLKDKMWLNETVIKINK